MNIKGIILRTIGIAVILLALLASTAVPVKAISEPDNLPNVERVYVWRNVLVTGDMLVVIKENTPYATPPTDINYTNAFIWRFIDTDNVTELAQATGYDYNDYGYNYNIIGFYFDADDAPAWGQEYKLNMTGTPIAFADPPQYTFDINTTDYSSLTDTTAVKADIADKIITLAGQLDNDWGLSTTESLLLEIEAGTVLSMEGEAFFRGALYGIQAMAPAAFRLVLSEVTIEDRTWTDNYTTTLSGQYGGTYLETAFDAGETMLDVSYNLFGLLITLTIAAVLIFGHWYILKGGNIWKSAIEVTPVLIVCTSMSLFGLGELGLVAAVAWIFCSAKMWGMA